LAILGQNETYAVFYVFWLCPFRPKTVPMPLREADIYRRYKQIQHLKINWNIARNVMCFIMNVIIAIARQKFLAKLIYLSFSKFNYRQNMF